MTINVRSDTETTNAKYSTNRLLRIYCYSIDLFTDTAAILNYLDLRSIMGCLGGHEHVPTYSLSIYARFSDQFFFKF